MRYQWKHWSSLPLLACIAICAPATAQSVPPGFSHQGYIEVGGEPFNGNGAFRFALVDGSGNNVWTNDSSEIGTNNMPASAVALSVEEGLYQVVIGGGTSTDAFPEGVFEDNPDISLRVWFDDGSNGVQMLTPDKPIRAVPRARQADVAEAARSVPNVITVDRVDYISPRTHELVIGPTEFGTGNFDANFNRNFVEVSTNGPNRLLAPVELPVGATVESVEVFFEDNDADSEVNFNLLGNPLSGGTRPVLFVDTTEGHTGMAAVKLSGIGREIESGVAYTFVAHDLASDWQPGSMSVRGVVIEYSLDTAL